MIERHESSDQPPTSRREAAALMRSLRASPPRHRLPGIGWLISALPDRPMVVRLAAEALLAAGDLDAAEALVTRALVRRPLHPGFTALRIEVLLARNRAATADAEARVLAARRPERSRSWSLAGRAAMAVNDPLRAARDLRRALAIRPRHERVQRLLVVALIAAGRADAAEIELRGLRREDPILRSRVLRAQGRVRDAVDVLEAHRRLSGHEAILIELLDCYEQMGSTRDLEALLASISTPDAATRLRMAEAHLGVGAFGSAARLAVHLRQDPRLGDRALAIATVALAAAGRTRGARRAFARLQRTRRGASVASLARLWSRAAAARAMARQIDPRTASGDRNPGVLQPLVQHALEVLERDPRSETADLRARCRTSLGTSAA